jgi:hypothetical protein
VAAAVATAASRVPVGECGAFFSFVYFGAVDHDAARRLDAEAHLVADDTVSRPRLPQLSVPGSGKGRNRVRPAAGAY